jgi:hypothetical protein
MTIGVAFVASVIAPVSRWFEPRLFHCAFGNDPIGLCIMRISSPGAILETVAPFVTVFHAAANDNPEFESLPDTGLM